MALKSPTTSSGQVSPVTGYISGLRWFHSFTIAGNRWSSYCTPRGMMRRLPPYLVCCWGSVSLNCKVARHTQRCKCIPAGLLRVIRLSAFDICHGIHQTIGRVSGDRHNAAEIIQEEAIGTSHASITPSLKGIACCSEIDIYVLDEVVDLVGAVEAAIDSANHESHVNVDNPLVLTVCLKHKYNGHCPAQFGCRVGLQGHECTLREEGA